MNITSLQPLPFHYYHPRINILLFLLAAIKAIAIISAIPLSRAVEDRTKGGITEALSRNASKTSESARSRKTPSKASIRATGDKVGKGECEAGVKELVQGDMLYR